MIEDMNENSCAIMSFIENVHRKNLNYFEEAEGIKKLMEVTGYNQSKICGILDMSQPSVANKLRLLRLDDDVKKLAMESGFGERITRALLHLPTKELQIRASTFIASKNMNAVRAEEYIQQLADTLVSSKRKKPIFSDYRLIFNGVDKVVEEIKKTGLTVLSKKTEEENYMCYTIKVEKIQKHII